MAKYKLQHKGSSYVAWDEYDSLEEAVEATYKKPKHQDKVVKIFEDKAFGGFKGYFMNGEEIKGENF